MSTTSTLPAPTAKKFSAAQAVAERLKSRRILQGTYADNSPAGPMLIVPHEGDDWYYTLLKYRTGAVNTPLGFLHLLYTQWRRKDLRWIKMGDRTIRGAFVPAAANVQAVPSHNFLVVFDAKKTEPSSPWNWYDVVGKEAVRAPFTTKGRRLLRLFGEQGFQDKGPEENPIYLFEEGVPYYNLDAITPGSNAALGTERERIGDYSEFIRVKDSEGNFNEPMLLRHLKGGGITLMSLTRALEIERDREAAENEEQATIGRELAGDLKKSEFAEKLMAAIKPDGQEEEEVTTEKPDALPSAE